MRNFPLLLGHRGSRCSASVHENSIAAFDLALQHGCDGFEFDLRLTADGAAVICHNQSSRRTRIAGATRSRLGHLPSLDDVLQRFAKSAFLDIELKVPGLAQPLLSALNQLVPEWGFVVSSFLPDVLVELAARAKPIPLGIIFERRVPRWWEWPVQYVIPQHSLITPELIRDVHNAGKSLFAWTVNQEAEMLRLAEWGVDGIISDKTDLLVKTLRPAQKQI